MKSNAQIIQPYEADGVVYHADTCRPLVDAVERKKLRFNALARFTYPGQRLFLDGAFGAHMLMYICHFNELKLEKIFKPRTISGKMIDKRPKLLPEIKSRRISANATAIFNPNTGSLTFITKAGASLI